MTTKDGQLTWAAKRAKGMANSVEANERRRRREPPIINWDDAIANLLDILDDTSLPAPPQPSPRSGGKGLGAAVQGFLSAAAAPNLTRPVATPWPRRGHNKSEPE
jgi:hypothetical protein